MIPMAIQVLSALSDRWERGRKRKEIAIFVIGRSGWVKFIVS